MTETEVYDYIFKLGPQKNWVRPVKNIFKSIDVRFHLVLMQILKVVGDESCYFFWIFLNCFSQLGRNVANNYNVRSRLWGKFKKKKERNFTKTLIFEVMAWWVSGMEWNDAIQVQESNCISCWNALDSRCRHIKFDSTLFTNAKRSGRCHPLEWWFGDSPIFRGNYGPMCDGSFAFSIRSANVFDAFGKLAFDDFGRTIC